VIAVTFGYLSGRWGFLLIDGIVALVVAAVFLDGCACVVMLVSVLFPLYRFLVAGVFRRLCGF